MDLSTREVVLALNPWLVSPDLWRKALAERLPGSYIPRRVYERVGHRWREKDKVHLLVGPRQAGKTTLLWKHLLSIGPRVLFVNLEDRRLRQWCNSAALFTRDLKESFERLDAVFLDEIQHLPEAALFLKGVADLRPGCPVLVTGSSSFQLASRTRESLAGRATRTVLLPFSFQEVAGEAKVAGKAALAAERARLLSRHLRFGGYPPVWTGETPEVVLADLLEAFLGRDASDFFRIQRPDAMEALIRLMAGQTGSLVNLSEWAAICGISRDTVLEYARILENAHLVELLPAFVAGKRAEITASRKAFFVDGGIRNALLRDFRPAGERVDAGQVTENWVYSELRKRLEAADRLYYWRTRAGAEVDFVVARGRRIVGIAVKAGPMRSPQLSRSARSFIEAYAPAEFVVVNATLEHTEPIGKCTVRWIPIEAFAVGPLSWETEHATLPESVRSGTPPRHRG